MTIDELAAHEPPESFAVGAYEDDTLVAVGLVGAEGGSNAWRIRGMATAPEARGRGAGSAVLAALIAHAAEHGATRVWCNARIGARSLYERAGLHVASEEFEVPEIGPHYVMEMALDQAPEPG
ncbi:MAG TPA: GNAT family N-acetyltransferase [Solirubrobacteraceae bacterium]|jgi:ribosomal protein S18 acetylase RimI-like enzyme